MGIQRGSEIKPATGKLGVLTPGMGAVATTYFAGNLSIRKGLTPPVGSLCELGTIRLGKRTDNNTPKIKDYVPLAQMSTTWCSAAGTSSRQRLRGGGRAGVLEAKHLLADQGGAVGDQADARGVRAAVGQALDGPNVKTGTSKMHLAEQVMEDIKSFKARATAATAWCASGAARPRSTASRPTCTRRSPSSRRACAPATTTSRRRRSTPTRRSSSASRTPTARPTCRSTPRR
jgi:myo-inositol-1-phosphate synthase